MSGSGRLRLYLFLILAVAVLARAQGEGGWGGGADGLAFHRVGGPELRRSRVPGNCQPRANVRCSRGSRGGRAFQR